MIMSVIADNLSRIHEKINDVATKSGRDPKAIKLIAVSKTRSLNDVQSVISAGHFVFGENTIQDALTKIPGVVEHSAEWHFIGHLQTNKAKQIPVNFQWLHTLDSLKLAEKLSRAVNNSSSSQPVNSLIQINVSGEATKSGAAVTEIEALIDSILSADLSGIKLRGLMTIGVANDETQTRKIFSTLKELQEMIKQQYNLNKFDQCSMGMSGDYALAIEEGSTMVRVGTAIFGERAVK